MAPRKTAGSKAAGKRKRVQSDDSDIRILTPSPSEVLAPVPITPRKKNATLKALPASEGPVPTTLAEPDFSSELDAMLQVAAGHQDISAAPLTVVNSTRPRPVRSRTKTEKAKLLAGPAAIKNSGTPPAIGGIDSDDDLPEQVLPILPKRAATVFKSAEAPTPAGIPIDHGLQLAESLCDDVVDESDDTGHAGGQVDHSGYSSAASIEDGDTVSVRSDSAEALIATIISPYVNQSTIMLGSTEPVMVKDLQHPKLYTIYDGLPVLNQFRDVVLFGGRPNVTVERADFGVVIQGLPKQSVLIILCALTFTRSDFFVNTARVNPDCLGMDRHKLVIANTTTPAVCIMVGTVSFCELIQGSYTSGSYTCHRIGIIPFAQEMRRDSSVWGMKLGGWNNIVGPVESGGFAFHSRPKTYTQPVQSPQTPEKKKSKMSMMINMNSPSGSRTTTPVNGRGVYLSSRSFEDPVPIYDGRGKTTSPFKFTGKDFDRLTTMPLYRKGHEDLPNDAIVAVGYTLNTYISHYNGGSSEHLSVNVQFVILLAIKPT
ncbi:hypothetical protein BD779DRAFT_1475393 [Infundibulicybe gibba]|nr:hypothetical protein BD779DRAFT_1475393 [Infundibulicybe gibba]